MPDWLSIGGSFRFRTEGRSGIGFREGNEEGYGLTRLRVDVGVEPSPQFRLFFQGQDSRSPGILPSSPSLRDPFDLHQGYLELGHLDSGLRLRAGRQEMPYGAERLISRNNWRNTGRTFDAVKLMLGSESAGADVFAASLVQTDVDAFNKHRDGENFYGVYGHLRQVIPKTTLEPYLLYTTNPQVSSETGIPGDADRYTIGVRIVRELKADLEFNMEVARQWGSFSRDDISAWMGYGVLEYRASQLTWEPRLSLEYSHVSGDSDPSDGVRETFDSLFLTGHRYYGFADLIGARNIRDLRFGVGGRVFRKTTLAVDVHNFWLASRKDHLYAASQQVSVRSPAGGAASSRVGWELDFTLRYRLSSRITIGAGIGHLFPGAFLKQNSPGAGSSYPYWFWDQNF